MNVIVSLNREEQRQAEDLLRGICSDGPRQVDYANRASAELLAQHGLAEFVMAGNRIEATARGRETSGNRILHAAP